MVARGRAFAQTHYVITPRRATRVHTYAHVENPGQVQHQSGPSEEFENVQCKELLLRGDSLTCGGKSPVTRGQLTAISHFK